MFQLSLKSEETSCSGKIVPSIKCNSILPEMSFFIQLEPGLGPPIRVESENGQFLPDVMIHVARIHKEYIMVLNRRAYAGPRAKILAELNGEQLLKEHHGQKL